MKRLYPYITDEKAAELERLEQHGVKLNHVINSGLRVELEKIGSSLPSPKPKTTVEDTISLMASKDKALTINKLKHIFYFVLMDTRQPAIDTITYSLNHFKKYFGLKLQLKPFELYEYVLKFQQDRNLPKEYSEENPRYIECRQELLKSLGLV